MLLSINLLKKYVDLDNTYVHADVGEIITIYDLDNTAENILSIMDKKDIEYLRLLEWKIEDGAFVHKQNTKNGN